MRTPDANDPSEMLAALVHAYETGEHSVSDAAFRTAVAGLLIQMDQRLRKLEGLPPREIDTEGGSEAARRLAHRGRGWHLA